MMVNQRWSVISDILRPYTIIICYSNNNSNIVRLSLSYARNQVEEIVNRLTIVFKIFSLFSYLHFFSPFSLLSYFFFCKPIKNNGRGRRRRPRSCDDLLAARVTENRFIIVAADEQRLTTGALAVAMEVASSFILFPATLSAQRQVSFRCAAEPSRNIPSSAIDRTGP